MAQRFDTTTAPATPEPLTPMVKHYLLIGTWPKFRCRSWVAFAMLSDAERELLLDRVWAAHKDALMREAREYNFTAHASIGGSHDPLQGPEVARWRAEFQKQNEY